MHYALLLCCAKALFALLVLGQADHWARRQISSAKKRHTSQGLHLPLFRRSARFSSHQLFNVSYVSSVLLQHEKRYLQTSTVARENRIVRQWLDGRDGIDDYMFSGAGLDGNWYTIMSISDPPQDIEVDIDMLSPDFHFLATSSGQGDKYDVFSSISKKSSNEFAHPLCPVLNEAVTLQPFRRYSLQTLSNSGVIFGLSPLGQSSSLSRLSSPSLLAQLLEQNLIEHNIFSLTLLDAESGVLSLGGSIAPDIEETKIRAEKEFAYVGNPNPEKMEDEIRGAMSFAIPAGSTHEHHFKWTDVGSGAVAGWHITLVAGIWINGVKVLKNQPVLFDVNCPFILAPPGAAQAVYEAIPGARSLASLLDDAQASNGEVTNFYAVPCLNEMDIAFEIADWRFPFGKSELREDAVHGPFGGRFSLGQVDLAGNSTNSEQRVRSGYCVGVIVKSLMGARKEASRSAMRDVWILGEPFFRGLGVAFDMGGEKGKTRVGVRIY